MNILITFCNSVETRGYPCLGLLNSTNMEFRFIELPNTIPQLGMEGIALSSRYMFIGNLHSFDGRLLHTISDNEIYASPSSLLVFDLKTFQFIHEYVFNLVKDVHSFLLSKDEKTLYVVSTGTDEIVEIQLDGARVIAEKVFWRPEMDADRSDNFHMNSICEWQGNIYVSGFGKRNNGEGWNSANNGFIYNITQKEFVVSGLKHPHSIAIINNQMTYCESRNRKLRFIGEDKVIDMQGYTRGLCTIEGKIFIGTSAGRRKSKSTRKAVEQDNLQDIGCTISHINAESFKVEDIIDLNNFANEIYEFMPVNDVAHWPLFKPQNYRLQFEQTWSQKLDSALNEIKRSVPSGEAFILVDDNQWSLDSSLLPENQALHFLENDGVYWGNPENDEIAINELERTRQRSVHFIAFGWPSFWWFNHYKNFSSYLENRYKRVLNNERVILFDLI